MSQASSFRPDWASKPGDTIRDILKARKLSVRTFADQIGHSKQHTDNIIDGAVEINHELANKFESILGASKDFWLNREFNYRRDLLRIEEEKCWLKQLPIKSMTEFRWIRKSTNPVGTCLDFFDVPDVSSWRKKYANITSEYYFRTSAAYESEVAAVATWLRRGEIKANSISCGRWNQEAFSETLEAIRPLTKKKHPKDFLPILIDLCAACGVAVVIAQTPTGCRASGATKFLSKQKALLLLSFRYLSDDQFWFTFYHEAGHLVCHGETELFIEGMSEVKIDKEHEANLFAGAMLIPHHLEGQLASLRGNKRDIIEFAIRAGISPGIVVGQLQHRGYFKKSYLNSFKRWYDRNEINMIVEDTIH